MDPIDPEDRRPALSNGSTSREDVRHQPVLGPVVDLLAALDEVKDRCLDSDRADGPFALWHDSECAYIEAHLPGWAEWDIDLSIYQGRMLIRISR